MRFIAIIIAAFFCLSAGVGEAEDGDSDRKLVTVRGELKLHSRWSEDSRFRLSFPFPPDFIPRGQDGVFLRTVSPGNSLELSAASVILDLDFADNVTGKVRVNFIDLYNRNPTSTDQTINLKEGWILFGKKRLTIRDSETPVYLLFGKAPKFERQPERNLESYGLVSTAFNRFEDVQLLAGGTLAEHFYWRGQVSGGNPVFFRDVNALAGDNGNDDFRFPNPELHKFSGFPILYDAEIEEISIDDHFELGVGVGYRHQNETGDWALDLLGFYYQRDLADSVDLRGTFYGGDLDLLDGTMGISLPIQGREKKEFGGNVEFHWKGFRVFFQGCSQELAGLERIGYEAEFAWRFPLPPAYSINGTQLFTSIQPVVRYSKIDNKFRGPRTFPAPSTFWDWQKVDAGLRVGIVPGVDLTAEYSFNDIVAPVEIKLNELLTTVRVRF